MGRVTWPVNGKVPKRRPIRWANYVMIIWFVVGMMIMVIMNHVEGDLVREYLENSSFNGVNCDDFYHDTVLLEEFMRDLDFWLWNLWCHIIILMQFKYYDNILECSINVLLFRWSYWMRRYLFLTIFMTLFLPLNIWYFFPKKNTGNIQEILTNIFYILNTQSVMYLYYKNRN